MKKLNSDQQARLDVLTGQSELSDIEAAELQFLQKLGAVAAESETEEEVEEPEAADESETEETDTPDEELEAEEPEAEASAPKLTIFQKANAVLNSRKALVANADNATTELNAALDEITTLKAENARLAEEAKQGKALAARVAELEHEATTVSAGAARIAASNHVAESDLPEASSDMETLEDIRTQMAATTDPREKGRLAQKAKLLREAGSAASLN